MYVLTHTNIQKHTNMLVTFLLPWGRLEPRNHDPKAVVPEKWWANHGIRKRDPPTVVGK